MCFSLCLYGTIVKINQSELSISTDLDQRECTTLSTTYDSRNSKVESDLSCVPVGVLAGLE